MAAGGGRAASGQESPADPPQQVVQFPQAELDFFEKKIRPMLVTHCYECHSKAAADKNKLRGGLYLDSRAGMLAGGDSGPSIVPGQPDESLLLESLRYESFEMPPKGQLPPGVIADFAKWIQRGAADPRQGETTTTAGIDIEAGRQHWAYRPIHVASIPPVDDASIRSVVDAYVVARHRKNGTRLAPEADRRTLIRRLHFDLIGLPPTPAEIEMFLADRAPGAYERLVDRLLASPHFGERWGRHWLDVVRYADSITLRGFLFPEAWRYRDYVVDTFNSDRPFDVFVRQQVAGDLLPADSLDERRANLIATTFLALGNNNLEDQDKSKLRMDVVDEQLETIGRGFLAQTIGCARCHDHKFDPIPTRDYYALAGILRNTKTLNHENVSKWIELPVPLPPEREQEFQQIAAVSNRLQNEIKQLKSALNGGGGTKASIAVDQLAGVVVDDLQAVTTGQWTASTSVGGYVGSGYQHENGEVKGANTAEFTAQLPHSGEYEVRFAFTPASNRSPAVPVTVVSADGQKTVTINQRRKPSIDGRFESLGQYRFDTASPATVRVSNAGTEGVVIIDAVQFLPTDAVEDLQAKTEQRKPDNAAQQKRLKQLEAELKAVQQQSPPRPRYMSVQEEQQIEDTPIHIRGSVHNLGDPVPRGFLEVATYGTTPQIGDRQSGRRQLGEWITSSSNPLTSRVIANRVWHWLFGSGLVRTTDNFGTTGETPSHPELLDYLAHKLIHDGWSVKRLVREIVLSSTYRQSSRDSGAMRAIDPQNRWLWRMNPRRLEAENLMDSILSVSGRLDTRMTGSMLRSSASNDYNYRHTGDRRALYWPVLRNSLPDAFEVFDFANPSMVTGRRDISSTASQALFLLNNPWVIDQAEHAARRLLSLDADSDEQRLVHAFLLTLGREPSEQESRTVLAFIHNNQSTPEARERTWTHIVQALFASVDFRYIR